jgi:hypothetical protein
LCYEVVPGRGDWGYKSKRNSLNGKKSTLLVHGFVCFPDTNDSATMLDLFSLEGRTALITEGGKGIGQDVAIGQSNRNERCYRETWSSVSRIRL